MLPAAVRYSGPFRSFADAADAALGYDHPAILAQLIHATMAVLDGRAVYEQDGVTFQTSPPPPGPTLAALLMSAASEGGHLSVLDFGGSLGTHYLRWRPWLKTLRGIRWHVIEQQHIADAGREIVSLREDSLTFSTSLKDHDAKNGAVLASSVLQYLPQPYSTLHELANVDARVLIIDRTPLADNDQDQVLMQSVSKPLTPASYPLSTLSRSRIREILAARYRLLEEFGSSDPPIRIPGATAEFRGQIWIRKA